MDKWRQDKFYLDKCCHDSLNQFKMVPGIYFYRLVKNRVSDSLDILDMDKCCHDKCCLDKCLRDSSIQEGPRNLPFC